MTIEWNKRQSHYWAEKQSPITISPIISDSDRTPFPWNKQEDILPFQLSARDTHYVDSNGDFRFDDIPIETQKQQNPQ